MKAVKWRDLTDDEIRQRARELAEEIFNVRFQLAMGVAKNPSRLGQARRDLARAKTVLGERGVTVAALGPSQPAGPLIVGERPAPPAPAATPDRRRGAQRRAAPSRAGRRSAESRKAPTAGRRSVRTARKKG
jgi:large subunit ribosomal protein L29